MTINITYSYEDCPTLEDFSRDDSFMRAILGPVGGGKSSACVIELVNRALQQAPGPDGVRRSRWAVIRNTFPELRDTTIRTIFQWLPPQHFGRYVENRHSYVVKAFPGVEFELLFLALDRPDDIKKLLSLEITGAWVNEAREVPWAVIDVLQTRVGRYPAQRDGGATFHGIWLDTNPPDADSKFYRFFEEVKHPAGFAKIFKQPSGLADDAENVKHLPGGRRYYENLAVGKSPEWVKVYVHGQYGFVVEGMPVYPEYNDAIHCKKVDPIEGVPIMRGYDFGLCYSDDTEVLTNHGWKLFKDVDERVDLAASRDPQTGCFAWAPIAFKVAEPFKGELLHWQSTELDMMVTPEHRVPYTHRDHPGEVRWASAQWLADNLGRHHMVDLTSQWAPAVDEEPIWGLAPRTFAAFMGLFLSEGSAWGKTVRVYQIKDDHKAAMREILAATGWDWRESASGWSLYNQALTQWLQAMGDQRKRRIPEVIRGMSPDALMAFIDAYTMGDGSIRTRSNGAVEHTLFTISTDMAGDFQEIAQKVGWNSSVRWRKPQTSVITEGNTKRGIVNTGGWALTFKKRAKRAELHRRNFKRVPYDGLVYCLNVPWHTLYVRRNGVPHWNGNTPACVFSQLLPDGRWLIFDEMTSDNMSVDEFTDNVLEHCARAFRGHVSFEDYGDPAGNIRAETDKRSCFDIMRAKGIDIDAAMTQEPTLRQECVRKALRTLVGGEPQLILHPRCKQLRKGFMGGYHRRRMQTSGPERYSEKPDKGPLSHVHDAAQYTATMLFGAALTSISQNDDDFWERPSYGDDGRDPESGY